MAPLPGRDHHLLCLLVAPLSVGLRACRRTDAGARTGLLGSGRGAARPRLRPRELAV